MLTKDFQKRSMIFGAALVVLCAASLLQGQSPTIGPQVQVDDGGVEHANETSAAARAWECEGSTGIHAVAAWNDYRTGDARVRIGISLNGGTSWTGHVNLVPQITPPSTKEFDPMTAVDPRTGFLYAGGVWERGGGSDSGLFVARKAPCSNTFEPGVDVIGVSANYADKPWMSAGRRHDTANSTRIYVAYFQESSNANITAGRKLTWSDTNGSSWTFPQDFPVRLGSDCRGTLPRVGPGGELYISMYDQTKGQIVLQRSLDSGQTFVNTPIVIADLLDFWPVGSLSPSDARCPGNPLRVNQWPALAVSLTSGDLYCVFFDTTNIIGQFPDPVDYNLDLYFTRSTDGGSTWSKPKLFAPDTAPPGDQFHPWIEVSASGRLHLQYYDAPGKTAGGVDQHDGDTTGKYQNRYGYSDDGGITWHFPPALTAEWFLPFNPPIPIAFADYVGMAVSGNTVIPVYTQLNSNFAFGNGDIKSHVITP